MLCDERTLSLAAMGMMPDAPRYAGSAIPGRLGTKTCVTCVCITVARMHVCVCVCIRMRVCENACVCVCVCVYHMCVYNNVCMRVYLHARL